MTFASWRFKLTSLAMPGGKHLVPASAFKAFGDLPSAVCGSAGQEPEEQTRAVVELIRPSLVFVIGDSEAEATLSVAKKLDALGQDYAIVIIGEWRGDATEGPILSGTGDGSVASAERWLRVLARIQASRYADRIFPLREDTLSATAMLVGSGLTANLVYLGEATSYVPRFALLNIGKRLLAIDGVLAGNGFRSPAIRNAVIRFAEENKKQVGLSGDSWAIVGKSYKGEGKFQNVLASTPISSVVTDGWAELVDRSERESAFMSPSVNFDPSGTVSKFFPQQSLASLSLAVDALELPERLSLKLHSVQDAYLMIMPGCDGVIFNADGQPIGATTQFVPVDRIPAPDVVRQLALPLQRGLFVGFDSLWRNYYHWVCVAISKTMLFASLGVSENRFLLAIPSYDDASSSFVRPSFSVKVWEQSLSLVSDPQRIMLLRPGIYKVPEIKFFLTTPPRSSMTSLMPAVLGRWDVVRKSIKVKQGGAKKVCVLRRDSARLQESSAVVLQAVASRNGYRCCYLEDLDFHSQAMLFAHAERVVAPHGAGLSNLVFSPPGQSVLELNSPLGGESGLRPWFFLLARAKQLDYSFVDMSRLGPGVGVVEHCLEKALN